MKPILEPLEPRLVPAAILPHEQITIVSLGGDAPDREAMVSTLAQYALPVAGDYGVGAGTVAASVVLPSTSSDAAIQQEIAQGIQSGALPTPGPSSLYLVFGNQPLTDAWTQQDAGYHSWFWLAGQQVAYAEIQPNAWSISAVTGHEITEAGVDPFGGNPEVCDPFNGWTYNCHGYQAPFVQGADGQPLVGVGVTEQQTLDALPWQAFADTLFSVLAEFNPWLFAGEAQTAAAAHQDNPLKGTPEAMPYESAGQTAAWEVLEMLASSRS